MRPCKILLLLLIVCALVLSSVATESKSGEDILAADGELDDYDEEPLTGDVEAGLDTQEDEEDADEEDDDVYDQEHEEDLPADGSHTPLSELDVEAVADEVFLIADANNDGILTLKVG